MIEVRPVTYAMALTAVQHWHYSTSYPAGTFARYGAFEDGRYAGVILFGTGANRRIGSPFDVEQAQACELTRVALRDHEAPVTAFIARAIRRLRAEHPDRRVVVSYADPIQGHHGGIYQAGNWMYLGARRSGGNYLLRVNGKLYHKRMCADVFGSCQLDELRRVDPDAESVWLPTKHKYAYPLDRHMRRDLLVMAKPYPPRVELAPVVDFPVRDFAYQMPLFGDEVA